jgi:hypothetical protein
MNHKSQADPASGVPPVCIRAIMRKRKPRHRDQRCPGLKEGPQMTITTFDPPAQAGFDVRNPYLITLLRLTLCEQGWNMKRLALAMRWDQEFRLKVTELAVELGLDCAAADQG